MKVYIHDEKTGGAIEELCRKCGVEILTQRDVEKRSALPQDVSFFLDQVDAMVVEMTKPSQQIHFILAQAILMQKPTLCLYGKNQPPRELIMYIRKQKSPRPIKTYSYTEKTLPRAIANFIVLFDPEQKEHENIPSIKFTLRMTPRTERYLTWLSDKQGMSKADLLRNILENEADADKKFQNEQGLLDEL